MWNLCHDNLYITYLYIMYVLDKECSSDNVGYYCGVLNEKCQNDSCGFVMASTSEHSKNS